MAQVKLINDNYQFGFNKPEHYVFKAKKGLIFHVIRDISWQKSESEWMRVFTEKLMNFSRKNLCQPGL